MRLSNKAFDRLKLACWTSVLLFAVSQHAFAERIKDLASVAGVRNNQLVGYGLVVGASTARGASGRLFPQQSTCRFR